MWSHSVVLFYPHARSTASWPAKTGLPTLMAATSEPDIAQKQLSGVDVAGKTLKVHLDGYDQRDLLAGGPTKRPSFDAKFSRAGNPTERNPVCVRQGHERRKRI